MALFCLWALDGGGGRCMGVGLQGAEAVASACGAENCT